MYYLFLQIFYSQFLEKKKAHVFSCDFLLLFNYIIVIVDDDNKEINEHAIETDTSTQESKFSSLNFRSIIIKSMIT